MKIGGFVGWGENCEGSKERVVAGLGVGSALITGPEVIHNNEQERMNIVLVLPCATVHQHNTLL